MSLGDLPGTYPAHIATRRTCAGNPAVRFDLDTCRRIAAAITRAAVSPDASGFVMWCASDPIAQPPSSAIGVTPRAARAATRRRTQGRARQPR